MGSATSTLRIENTLPQDCVVSALVKTDVDHPVMRHNLVYVAAGQRAALEIKRGEVGKVKAIINSVFADGRHTVFGMGIEAKDTTDTVRLLAAGVDFNDQKRGSPVGAAPLSVAYNSNELASQPLPASQAGELHHLMNATPWPCRVTVTLSDAPLGGFDDKVLGARHEPQKRNSSLNSLGELVVPGLKASVGKTLTEAAGPRQPVVINLAPAQAEKFDFRGVCHMPKTRASYLVEFANSQVLRFEVDIHKWEAGAGQTSRPGADEVYILPRQAMISGQQAQVLVWAAPPATPPPGGPQASAAASAAACYPPLN